MANRMQALLSWLSAIMLLVIEPVSFAQSPSINSIQGIYLNAISSSAMGGIDGFSPSDALSFPYIANFSATSVPGTATVNSAVTFNVTPDLATFKISGDWHRDAGPDNNIIRLTNFGPPTGMRFFVPGTGTRPFAARVNFSAIGDPNANIALIRLVDVTNNDFELFNITGYGQLETSPMGVLQEGHNYRLEASFIATEHPTLSSDATIEFKFGMGETITDKNYGAGLAGSGGFIPSLRVEGPLIAGLPMTLAIEHALGGAQAFILVSSSSANTPLPGGGTLLVGSNVAIPVTLSGTNPGTGAIYIPYTLPENTPNGTIYLQAIVVDPGVPSGYAVSRGLEVDFHNS